MTDVAQVRVETPLAVGQVDLGNCRRDQTDQGMCLWKKTIAQSVDIDICARRTDICAGPGRHEALSRWLSSHLFPLTPCNGIFDGRGDAGGDPLRAFRADSFRKVVTNAYMYLCDVSMIYISPK